MSIRDVQREIRKGDFVKGAASSRTTWVARPASVAGSVGSAVGKAPVPVAIVTAGGLAGAGAADHHYYVKRKKSSGETKKKVSKAWNKEDTAATGIGAAGGAALMPARQPRARGQRKYALNRIYERASSSAKDGVADIKISPTELGHVAEHKGYRTYNKGYTAASAKWNGFPQDYRYELDMYKDKKGRIRARQINGRHFAEVRNMQDQDIPTKVRIVEGEAPEAPAIKQAHRYLKSVRERRQLRDERGLDPNRINSRAKAYESSLGSPARIANEKAKRLHREPGNTAAKVGKPNLRGRQVAYVATGAGGAYTLNSLAQAQRKNPTAKAVNSTNAQLNVVRDKAADVIKPKNKELIPVAKRDDNNKQRVGAAALGATAGAAAMPVRNKYGKHGREWVKRHPDMKSGTYTIDMKEAQRLASPGARPGNVDYTTRMAADIKSGKYKPNPVARIVQYDDAARMTGGQHRVHARAWGGAKTQDVEVVRVPGKMGGTTYGAKAAATRVLRWRAPTKFRNLTPGSAEELDARNKKVSERKLKMAHKFSTATDRSHVAAGMTAKDMKNLRNKQIGFVAGGAGLAALGNERYLQKSMQSVSKREPGQPGFWRPIKRAKYALNRQAYDMGRSASTGAADGVKASIPKPGGRAIGLGAAGAAGLAGLAGAAKIGGDIIQGRQAAKVAAEKTRQAKIYGASATGAAGLLGGGYLLSNRSRQHQ